MALAGRWRISRPISLRLGAAARFGDVAAAQARSLVISGGAGIAWQWLSTSEPRPFELGARADLLVLRHELGRSAGASTTHLVRWLSGADLFLEGAWFFLPRAAVTGALGAEAAFGDTYVFVGSERVATIALLRAIGEVGFRVRF